MGAMYRTRGFGEQYLEWLAQDLRYGISEDSLRSGIEERDAVCVVRGNYRVGGKGHDTA